MRVTAAKKRETRSRIVAQALELFRTKGYAETTVRDIAQTSEIATGTMFNYFRSKEDLAMSVLAESIEAAHEESCARIENLSSLEQVLFDQLATEVRHLETHRHFVSEVFEQTMTPFALPGACEIADTIRQDHLSMVGDHLRTHASPRVSADFELLTSHLYWSLYLAVIAFWSRDESPNQVDTLAMLDRTIQLFVQSLGSDIECAPFEPPSERSE